MYVLIGENGDYNTIESQFIGVFDDVEKAFNAKKSSLAKFDRICVHKVDSNVNYSDEYLDNIYNIKQVIDEKKQ